MITTLELVFQDSAEKDFIVRVADPRADLSPQEIKANMESIMAQNVFKSNYGELVKAKAARIVTRTSEVYDFAESI